jgi:membrane associated rhomboid family serine protease
MKQPQMQVNFSLTPVVKWLIILNVVIWVGFQLLLEGYGGIPFNRYFALYPYKFVYEFFLWQPLTFMFLHSLQVSHILFNMLMLWFVGVELEQRWGRKFFLSYYLICGAGSAILYSFIMVIYAAITGAQNGLVVPVVGASGAIFGLLLAYGILFGERTMYFMMVFPMKAKYFVCILGAIEVVSILTSGVTGGEVANLAHLGGLLTGYLTLLGWTRIRQTVWKRTAKKKGSGKLRLVVDNDKASRDDRGPKYWN